jgi:quinol monooxygenase YgiN
MRIRLFVKFTVKPQNVDAFIDAMQVAKSVLLNAPGCEAVELIQCAEDPCKVFLSEIWESREIHDAYAASMAEAGSMGGLAAFLEGAPEPSVFHIR